MAFASALVLLAALLHASWNALLRGGRDRFWTMAVMSLGLSAPAAVLLPFLAFPSAGSWPFILASGALHLAYNLGLVRMYRWANLGQSYPIARGSSPVLVTLGAAAFAGEWPSPLGVAGIVAVSGGILSLVVRPDRLAGARAGVTLLPALATGVCIAAYTVVDGLGIRAAGGNPGYTMWMFVLELAFLPVFLAARGWGALRAPPRAFVAPLVGGGLSFLAYAIVIWALSLGPMGPVSALRETSVVFAALIGWRFLGEPLTRGRLAACCVIAAGAICLGFAR